MKKHEENNFEIKISKPTKEELNFYKNNMENILPIIKKIMKGRSREEHLLAQDNFQKYLDLALKVSERLSREEYEKRQKNKIQSKKIIHKTTVDKQPKQGQLL